MGGRFLGSTPVLNAVRVWNAWFALLLQAALLGLEAQRVALRLIRVPAGGALAESEAGRVITEMVEALGEAQTAAAIATIKDCNSTSDATNRNTDASQSVVERPDDDETKLQLFAEDLSVVKETLETGRVRISTHTHDREALVDEDLAHERVEIETVPVNLQIDAVPQVHQEGDITIVPVVEERLVVRRRLMLKEEVRIRRVRSTERHQETVKLRYQEAVVMRQKNDA
jgi:uncharacterized protein (TIGR02271 family)